MKEMPNIDQLALIYNNVSDMIFLIQVEDGDSFRCINVNNAYLRGTGIERSDVINRKVEEVLEPEYARFVLSKYKEAAAKKHEITYEETIVLDAKGKCTFEITLIPILEDESCSYLLGVSRDVTNRKMEEEVLLKSEKMAIVGQLAAGVAHEIRNPLTSIKGFLKLIEKRTENDTKTSDYIDIMSSELNRIEEIINEFLMLAKPKSPKFETIDLTGILKDVVQIMRPQSNMLGIEITLNHSSDGPVIIGDKNLLKQVFINIIQNALDASSNGDRVRLTVKRKDHTVSVKIIDQGCGITDDRIAHLGEPFYSTKEKGTGLGLMICQQIVDKHHGQLAIDSKLKKGTTVEVILPLEESNLRAEDDQSAILNHLFVK